MDLGLLGTCQMKADVLPVKGWIKASFNDTDAATLMFIEIYDPIRGSYEQTLIPEEQHSVRVERGQECGLGVNMASADLDRAKKWIESCRTHHTSNTDGAGKSCVVPPVRMKIPLRIIDCKTLRVRALLPEESYTCLSYVWGNSRPAKAPINSQLHASAIPKTISDAIFVAEQLGIPRLWVDQYCIEQEESVARHESIASMHLIYGGAEVTIVAAAGTNSSHGLPGVLGTRRMHEGHTFVLGSRKFVKYPHLSEQVRRTRWNGRGWTFQEALLSLRLLVFTETQMYFQCANMHCHESWKDERKNRFRSEQQIFPTQGIGSSAIDIFDRICEYFPRELSFSADNLKAVEGVLEAFGEAHIGKIRVRHFYGTPFFYDINSEHSNPTRSLCWYIKDSSPDAECKKHADSFNSGLPSWTWASQKSACCSGKTLVFRHESQMFHKNERVEYYITDRDGERISLLQYVVSGSKRYSEFHPWIDITEWTIQGYITRWNLEGTRKLAFAGLKNTRVYPDDDIPKDTEKITAIFLPQELEGFIPYFYFLLVKPATLGTFSRVGILLLGLSNFEKSTVRAFRETPERILRSWGLDGDATVERKTVRIV